MGGSSSSEQEPPPMSPQMLRQSGYHNGQPLQPSIEDLVQSIPKMMRVTDDLHLMVSYMGDLRNIAVLMTALGILGGIGFLIFKYMQHRNQLVRRRRYAHEMDISRQYSHIYKPYGDNGGPPHQTGGVPSSGNYPPPNLPNMERGQVPNLIKKVDDSAAEV